MPRHDTMVRVLKNGNSLYIPVGKEAAAQLKIQRGDFVALSITQAVGQMARVPMDKAFAAIRRAQAKRQRKNAKCVATS